ncbi:hypothetical protein GRX01_01965 [Halobaculum sp. WSA2]|uniref:DUF7344 domain-containing protein n=1 Tax=Halobaculum saliterrae TaxID=2073113 RepID=A0A6B0SN17_9EURY|nr:hypothetical protein [Halobaculum saliterrae]MXR40125.1 hypothetical protein [Halobaculum saliterrae]
MDQGGRPITTDAALRLLAERQRRAVVRRLADAEEPVTVESLAASLATTTSDVAGVRIGLRHSHLPKLHDADVIDYDAEDGTVRRGPRFDAVASLLRTVTAHRELGDGSDRSTSE